jgi:hypothetical protein
MGGRQRGAGGETNPAVARIPSAWRINNDITSGDFEKYYKEQYQRR